MNCSCGGVLKDGNCSCVCPPGVDGVNGAAGDSAYDVWITDGNVGTEADFLASLVGATGNDGNDGTPGVPNPKINFYAEFIGTIDVKDTMPDPTVYHFPTGYGGNTYTNSTGIARDYLVSVSYDCTAVSNNSDREVTWLDGAIIKTVSAVDSVEYESAPNLFNIRVSLYDGTAGIDELTLVTTNKLLSVDASPVEVRFAEVHVTKNIGFFKKVTLNDGESISLKFKAFNNLTDALLERAQIMVLEID